jgi:hypothetical protein
VPEQTLTFEQYLDGLPDERRGEVERVWRVVRESVPAGYVEEVGPKFLTFKTGEEMYIALASQKNYISLYLMPVYVFPELKAKLDGSGRRLKCGKSCVNFKRAEDLPLDVLSEIVAATPPEAYRARVRDARSESKAERAGRR